jgi:hypothetical protein
MFNQNQYSSETLVILAKQLSTGLGWGRYLTRQLGFVLVSLPNKANPNKSCIDQITVSSEQSKHIFSSFT